MRSHLRDPAHVSEEWLRVVAEALRTGTSAFDVESASGSEPRRRGRLRVEWEGPGDGSAPGWTGEVVAALRHGENRFRLLSEATSEGVLVHEAGLVLDANQTLADLLGYARDELIGMDGTLLAAPEYRERLVRNIAEQFEEPYQGFALRRDGSRFPAEIRARTLRFGGRAIRVVSLRDITAQKRAEEALQLLSEAGRRLGESLDYHATLRSVAELVVPARADLCVVRLLQPDGSLEPVVARHVDPSRLDALREIATRHPAAQGAPRIPAEEVIVSGQAVLLAEIAPVELATGFGDERYRWLVERLGVVSHVSAPLRARGRAIGSISLSMAESGRRYDEADLRLVEDLAERIATAIDNALLYREAQAADRAKADFLSIISHELRTPLTSLIMFADLLASEASGPLTPAQREETAAIVDGSWHLSNVVDGIIEFARTGTDAPRLHRESTDLAALARTVVAQMRPLAEQKGLGMETWVPDAPVRIDTDRHRVQQILINLVSNAIAFTAAGGVRVTVSPGDDAVRIAVRDTGPGVAPEHLERIFDPFWQVEHPITRRVGGAGLGLAISRRLARLLGGDVEVASRPGEGSTFTLRLPLVFPAGPDETDG